MSKGVLMHHSISRREPHLADLVGVVNDGVDSTREIREAHAGKAARGGRCRLSQADSKPTNGEKSLLDEILSSAMGSMQRDW